MTIEQGFNAVTNALFGGRDQEVGTCSRCKCKLILDPVHGNCQPVHTFQFGRKNQSISGSIFNGAIGYSFAWEADLCDSCVHGLGKYVKGEV